MKDHATIIGLWPSPSIRTFADDVGAPYGTAQIWKHRNSIPPDCWDVVVAAAKERGLLSVTMEALQQAAPKRRRSRLGNCRVQVAA
jgi:hypothetical protein